MNKGMQIQKSLVFVWVCGVGMEGRFAGRKGCNLGAYMCISGEERVGREGSKNRLFREATELMGSGAKLSKL